MLWHAHSAEDVISQLGSFRRGLSRSEARHRLADHGPNRIDLGPQVTPWAIFTAQFKDFMVMTLLAATVVAALMGETTDALVILAILVLNATLGFIQEYRAERSLAALDRLAAPQADVLRDGERRIVTAADIVAGDIIWLRAGQRVPGDARLLDSWELEVDESLLTGESGAVKKNHRGYLPAPTPLAERCNLLFMGTMVTRGKAQAVVVATGMATEMGAIAQLLAGAGDEATPLQRRLDRLGRYLVAACLILCSVVTGLGIWRGEGWFRMFLVGVTLAVAAMPEGLPAVVTVALALGVQRMSRRQAIVRRLPAVETLGSATVICADKTGTLTTNEMTVQVLALGPESTYVRPEGSGKGLEHRTGPAAADEHALALMAAVLCNDALEEELPKKPSRWRGDATEVALAAMAQGQGQAVEPLRRKYPRLDERAFSSERRRMSVLVQLPGQQRIYTKGAPDTLLLRCTHYCEAGRMHPLGKTTRERLIRRLETMTQAGLRVLALAYRDVLEHEASWSEDQLAFIGLVGLWDPPRPQARSAVQRCLASGIIPIMITGDHPATAEAIAREVGILPRGGQVITGDQLDQAGEPWVRQCVRQHRVFARMSPQHKLMLVRALRSQGQVVAMTGDGVNDAPAVKEADIGVAMGLAGTDVTREAADVVLADDNFATIVAAVEEGRTIYANMRKFIRYLLSCNVGEVLVMLVGVCLGWPLPLLPMQVLWVNLVTDGLPALALGVEPSDPEYMQQPPRPAGESIFAGGLGRRILLRGAVMALVTSLVFIWSLGQSSDVNHARTMALVTLIFSQLFHAFECRSERRSWPSRGMLSNPWLVWACGSSALSTVLVVYWPALQPYFHTRPLLAGDWLIALGAGLAGGMLGLLGPRAQAGQGFGNRKWNRKHIQLLR